MSCDIHLYLETSFKQEPPNGTASWKQFSGRIRATANYSLFGLMCDGVRGESFPESYKAKGLPLDVTTSTWRDSVRVVNEIDMSDLDEGGAYITPSALLELQRTEQVQVKKSDIFDEYINDPDCGGHSWLSCDEFRLVLIRYKKMYQDDIAPEYWALLEAMKVFEEQNFTTRIIFWFDNL